MKRVVFMKSSRGPTLNPKTEGTDESQGLTSSKEMINPNKVETK